MIQPGTARTCLCCTNWTCFFSISFCSLAFEIFPVIVVLFIKYISNKSSFLSNHFLSLSADYLTLSLLASSVQWFIHTYEYDQQYSRIPQKEPSQLDLRLVLFYIIVEPCVCAIGSSSYFVILFFDDDICLSIECKKNKKVLKVNIHPNDRSMVCHWILTCLCETKG